MHSFLQPGRYVDDTLGNAESGMVVEDSAIWKYIAMNLDAIDSTQPLALSWNSKEAKRRKQRNQTKQTNMMEINMNQQSAASRHFLGIPISWSLDWIA